jgi:hypothetical protein
VTYADGPIGFPAAVSGSVRHQVAAAGKAGLLVHDQAHRGELRGQRARQGGRAGQVNLPVRNDLLAGSLIN